MDKIKRYIFLLEDEKAYNKLDELVEGHNELIKRIKKLEERTNEPN